MNAVRWGLISRIALLVIAVEVTAFGVLGWFYVHEYSAAADERLRARLHLVQSMIADEELPVSAVSRKDLLGGLLGAPYLDGMVIGGGGRVIVATDPANLGQPAEAIPGVDPAWFLDDAPTEQIAAGADTLTIVRHTHSGTSSKPVYFAILKVSTAELEAQKRAVARWGLIASAIFILLTSAAILLMAQRLITRRVDASLAVLKRVEDGALTARIPIGLRDELGALQEGINSMTGKLAALLQQQRQVADDMQAQKELLQSVIEHAPIRVFWKDRDLRYLGCNALFARDAGLAGPHELIGKSDFELSWRDQAARYQADDRAVMDSGVPKLDFEEPQTTPNGGMIWLSTSKVPLRGRHQEVIGVLGIYDDITQRKRDADELERHRKHLQLMVEERTAELSVAKEAAEAASVAKSAFLANMSHEIRTPLHAITGMVSLVRRSGVTPQQAGQLDRIDVASQHLLAVLNAILDLSKIEADKFVLDEAELSVAGIVDNVRSMIGDQAGMKDLEIAVETEGLPHRLIGDATRLRQALLNYASNAVKFTQQGKITLRARVEAEDAASCLVRFEVADTGIGIAHDVLPNLFAAFEQGDKSTTRKYGGTGLGLAITKRLATLMGGEVGVASAPGAGSTFWFTARLGKAAEHEDTTELAGGEAPEAVLRRDYADLRILLADDDPDNRYITETLLKEVWARIDSVEDGVEAVDKASRERYDVILLDMRMPRMDGLEAARRIRQLPGGGDVLILALTANTFPENREQCIAAGMDDLIPKAAHAEAPFAVILRWLRRKPRRSAG
ncbi:MAG: ATP-binding protein [Ignavibacteria bacterium]